MMGEKSKEAESRGVATPESRPSMAAPLKVQPVWVLFALSQVSNVRGPKGGQVGGSSRTDRITGRAGHHRASTYAPLSVHAELQEPSEQSNLGSREPRANLACG